MKRKSVWVDGVSLIGGLAALGAASAAVGAEPTPAAGTSLDEIVVTAQKREQRAQDVGITLKVYSGEELQAAGVTTAPDIAKLTPGVGVSGSFAGQNVMFSIRGVTQQDFQAHSEAPIAVYVDEGYLAANNAAGIGLLDVERVEVLKGPQGTLFGRNATGGLVSITTRKPTKDFTANASVGYGSYNEFKAEAAVGGPISDRVQGRVAVSYDRNNGWVENLSPTGGDLGGKKAVAARVHIAAQPSDALNLLFTGYIDDVKQSWGPYFLMSTRSVLQNGIPNAVEVTDPTGFGVPPSNFDQLKVNANNAQDSGSFNRIAGGTIRVNYDLGGLDLTSITDFKQLKYKLLLDDDASPIDFLDTHTTADVKNWSEELRLYKDLGNKRLTAGLYYLHINAQTTDLQRLFGLGGVQVSSPFALVTKSTSGFFQGEFDVAEHVSLVGGFRATREKKDYRYDAFVQALDGTPIVNGRSYRGDSSDWLYSWKAQIEYRPTRDLLMFAGYSRGTKAGSFNAPFAGGATPPDAEVPYKPEKLDSYEVGVKSTLADGKVTLNGSVFYYKYKDYQAFKFVNFSTVVTNNPATIKGAEAEFSVRPVKGLELLASASYVDAKVDDVPVSNALGTATLSRRPPFTSEWKALAMARYEFPLAGGTASLQADVVHTGNFFFSLTNFSATEVKSYDLVNARLAWKTGDQHWEFAAFGKNLSDERYRTVGFEASDFGGFTQVGYGEPRWFGGSVSYRF